MTVDIFKIIQTVIRKILTLDLCSYRKIGSSLSKEQIQKMGPKISGTHPVYKVNNSISDYGI